MRRIAVLGSTGSVGRTTLSVIGDHRDRLELAALAAGFNLDLVRRQLVEHRPMVASVADPADARRLRSEFPDIEIVSGAAGLDSVARVDGLDMAVVALVGAAGLRPTMTAIGAGVDVALATKEVLVMAGELVAAEAARTGARLLSVDSEMSALAELLRDRNRAEVSRLVLTASGGPFRDWPAERIAVATVAEAIAHPTWQMGRKISVDSATMMNKGLEVIEAHHLFALPEERIEVVVHPQSVVHALVELTDGSALAQLAVADMRLPIATALEWPRRPPAAVERLDLASVGRLDFARVDDDRFPAVGLARRALRAGGAMPIVVNAANEVAVGAFLDGRCRFDRISATIAAVMESFEARTERPTSIDEILAIDSEARSAAGALLGNTAADHEVRTG